MVKRLPNIPIRDYCHPLVAWLLVAGAPLLALAVKRDAAWGLQVAPVCAENGDWGANERV